MLYQEHIAVLEERLKLKDDQVLDARQKLDEREKQELKEKLSKNPGSVVLETYNPSDPLIGDLKSVFENSGWSVETKQSPYTGAGMVGVIASDRVSQELVDSALREVGVSKPTPEYRKPNRGSEQEHSPDTKREIAPTGPAIQHMDMPPDR